MPLVRRFTFDHDAIGPFSLVWNGHSDAGGLVADGRYTVFLNDVPFRVDVDATPPDLGWVHEEVDAFRDGGVQISPQEQPGWGLQNCAAQVSTAGVAIRTKRHVVDPNLERWIVRDPDNQRLESGTGQIYVPARDESGQVIVVNGVPEILRENGRPVDEVAWLDRRWYGDLSAVDRAGNRSLLPRTETPQEWFVTGVRRTPNCSWPPVPAALPRTRYLDSARPTQFPLRTRLFTDNGPDSTGGYSARFEYRAPSATVWQQGPETSGYTDLNLVEMGLTPGAVYRGRLSATATPGHSEEFDFRVCDESVVLTVEAAADPRCGHAQAVCRPPGKHRRRAARRQAERDCHRVLHRRPAGPGRRPLRGGRGGASAPV